MKDLWIRIVVEEVLCCNEEEKSALSTIIEAFRSMVGLSDFELWLDYTNCDVSKRSGSILFYTEDGMDPQELILNLDDQVEYERGGRDWITSLVNQLFKTISEINADYKSVVELFLNYRLWEVYVLNQFCSDSKWMRKEISQMCQKSIDTEDEMLSSESHYLYLTEYLKILVALGKDKEYNDQNSEYQLNRELKWLSDDSLKLYNITKRPVFIKLAAFSLGSINSPEMAEKLYLQYINVLNRENFPKSEIGKTYYELGSLYEKYSDRKSFMLNSVYKASGYYRKAFEFDSNNYRAIYKCILSPEKEVFGIDDYYKLSDLHMKLMGLKNSGEGTIRVYLYDYKVKNHIYAFRKRKKWDNTKWGSTINRNEVEFREICFKQILKIWDLMGLSKVSGSEDELQKHVQSRVREVLDLILLLRERNTENEIQAIRNRLLESERSRINEIHKEKLFPDSWSYKLDEKRYRPSEKNLNNKTPNSMNLNSIISKAASMM